MYAGYANHLKRSRAEQIALTDDGTITDTSLSKLQEAQGWICALCQEPLPELPSPDHITPLTKGGAHTISNIQIVCWPCNDRRRATLPAHVSSNRSILFSRYEPHPFELAIPAAFQAQQKSPADHYDLVRSLVAGLRAKRGLHQADVAKRLGKGQQFVSRVENKLRRLDVVEFVAYVRALGADPREAFREIYEQLPEDIAI